MAGVAVVVEIIEVRYDAAPERVQMNVADDLDEMPSIRAGDRVVAIRNENPRLFAASRDRAQEPADRILDRIAGRPNEQMEVIGHQGPRVDRESAFARQRGDAFHQIVAFTIVAQDRPPVRAPHHHVVGGAAVADPRPGAHARTTARAGAEGGYEKLSIFGSANGEKSPPRQGREAQVALRSATPGPVTRATSSLEKDVKVVWL
jgi:hypothetical protein